MLRILPFVLVFVLWVYCIVEVCLARHGIRHFSKRTWLVIVVLVPLIGSLAWLFTGRPNERARPVSAEDDEAFLRRIRDQAEEQRFRRQQQKRREEKERGESGDPESGE